MKPQTRQYLTFSVAPAVGVALLESDEVTAAGSRQATETSVVDQFFLTGSLAAQKKPAKEVFRLRQELGGGQCYADMRTFKKSKTKLRRTKLDLAELQSLLLAQHNEARRPEAWKLDTSKPLHPSLEARFTRTSVEFSQGETITVDQAIRCRSLETSAPAGECHLADSCLVTMQYNEVLPSSFKRLVYQFRLATTPVSLIDLCIEAACRPQTSPLVQEKYVA